MKTIYLGFKDVNNLPYCVSCDRFSHSIMVPVKSQYHLSDFRKKILHFKHRWDKLFKSKNGLL